MIFFETARQARVFLLLVYAGFLSALLYDAAAFVRRRSPRWLRPVWDVIWCLAAGLMCALALALGRESSARLYALLGLCCGAGIYTLGLRRAAKRLARCARRLFERKL